LDIKPYVISGLYYAETLKGKSWMLALNEFIDNSISAGAGKIKLKQDYQVTLLID
jgi:hypothetical protein